MKSNQFRAIVAMTFAMLFFVLVAVAIRFSGVMVGATANSELTVYGCIAIFAALVHSGVERALQGC